MDGAAVGWVPSGARGCGAGQPPYNHRGVFLAVATACGGMGPHGGGDFKRGIFRGLGADGVMLGCGGRMGLR